MVGERSRRLAAVFAVSLLMATSAPVAAQDDPVQPMESLVDVDSFAEQIGVSRSEALRRLALQGEIGELREYLEEEHPDVFAGMWVEHLPEFRIQVRLTDPSSDILDSFVADVPEIAGSLEVTPAEHTYAELVDDLMAIRSLSATVPFDAAVNELQNRVDIWVRARSDFDSFVASHGARTPSSIVVTVVDELSKPAASIYGGLRIDDSSLDDEDCTSGFSVRHVSQAVGVTVAGHCSNTGMNYGGTSLPYHNGTYGGSHDEQWHTTPGFTPINRIRYHEDGNTRPITSRRLRSAQSIGDPVCKYGVTTGYDCGNIINRSFAPSWVPNAQPTFVVAEQLGVDMCSPEDSGGPVFFLNAAWGTISGFTGSGSQAGKQVVYVAIDYVEAGLGVSILTQ